ncbi:MAG TPA: DEAD/DEAH box helicase [Thermoanaerobaculaceae bacterium]|nr:DEAD/DEAH box helicase [Thermoanaerobaculaceae bacterium]
MSFNDFPLDPALLRGISDLGFTDPTPIQRAALPEALAGRDILAAAMTGSGKTAAFALPILQRLSQKSAGATRALVLTPTRELAAQVREHLALLGRRTTVRSVAVFGGVKPGPQERALRAGADVVVATPGRLLDHIGEGAARFDRLEILVLDEADRMLDMGFLPDVRRILAKLPARRQTMLFSATLPEPIVKLSREVLTNPTRIDVGRPAAPATGVTHAVLPVPEKLKAALLVELLRRDEIGTALVFTRTKHRANRLALHLDKAGIACDRIHGNRSQAQRESALAAFKRGRLRILVATDLASRGLDVAGLPHVVNFDVPAQVDDYIHRVGRTARAETTGTAVTLASPSDEQAITAIERAVGRRIPRRTLAGFDYAEKPAESLEVPIAERIAAIRAPKAEERARTRANAERRAGADPAGGAARNAGGARPAAARTYGGRAHARPGSWRRRSGR